MKFYVTASLPYVNGEPHIGHAMEYVMADVLARHARSTGKDTFFSIGTDEHGGKVAEKARSENFEPKEFADKISQKFQDLSKDLNISNDKFIRTTDPDHESGVKQAWKDIEKDIYKGKYVGWYCTGDEAFVSEKVAKQNHGVCPVHQKPYEKIEEENYFFKLSSFSERILKAIESNEFRIIPDTRRNEILYVIREGLDDISISRPKNKIDWGIEVPGDDSQVMYVWFEALLNYITVLGYPDGAKFKEFWPADYQVIGKDIIRFHAANWPATLLALGLDLPKVLYVHGFINIDNKKMSKSLGNYVTPSEIIEKYSSDAFRYYFLRHIPSYEDGDFSWQRLSDSYQNELGNELGNAVQRTTSMIGNYLGGKVEIRDSKVDDEKINKFILACQFDRALDSIWEKVRELNQYVEDEKPWALHKQNETTKLVEVLTNQANKLIAIAHLLEPFMPEVSGKILAIFQADKVEAPKETLFPRLEETTNS